ncbi:MAG: hypothetical protein ACRD51_16375, partial [Candidatus Acidiferrum sp.]
MSMPGARLVGKSKLARKIAAAAALALLAQCCACFGAFGQNSVASKGWPTAAPKEFGIDPGKLAAFDADLAAGKYGLVDSILVLRCGTDVYDKTYTHDYAKIYGDRAKTEGPLNHDPQGPYNYFSTDFHPFY